MIMMDAENANQPVLWKSPGDDYRLLSNGNLVAAFPGVIALTCREKTKAPEKTADIVEKRFALGGGQQWPFAEVGVLHGITEMRARQIEKKFLKDAGNLLEGKWRPKGGALDERLIIGYRDIKKIWTGSMLVSQDEAGALLRERYGREFRPGCMALFMAIAGFAKIPSTDDTVLGFRGTLASCWCSRSAGSAVVKSAIQSLNCLFDGGASFLSDELLVKMRKASGRKITHEFVQTALAACHEIETGPWGARVKIGQLKNVADKAYRVLKNKDVPIHFSAIAREVNRLDANPGKIKQGNLKNQMIVDKRFAPIGKSGKWSLSEWNLPGYTIAQAIEKVLHESGNPMRFAEIFAKVGKRRPCKEISVRAYLQDAKFSQTEKGEYALTEWKEPDGNRKKQEKKRSWIPKKNFLYQQVQKEIRFVLCARPGVPFTKMKLYKEVNKSVQCDKYYFYGIISQMWDIRQFKADGRYYAVYESKNGRDQ